MTLAVCELSEIGQLESSNPDLSVVERTVPPLGRRLLSLRERYLVSIYQASSAQFPFQSVDGIPYRLLIVRTGVVKEGVDELCACAVGSRSAAPRRPVVQMRMRSTRGSGSALTSAESAARWKGLEWSRRRENKYFLTETPNSVFLEALR